MSGLQSEANSRIRVVIADDEPLARERLRHLLASARDMEIVGECADGDSALECIRRTNPDAAFLDIRMPGLNGLEVVRKLGADLRAFIVFVTAHDEYAVQAFESPAVDFLLKPFDRERFQTTLRRVRARLGNLNSTSVAESIRGLLENMKERPKQAGRVAVKSEGRVTMVQLGEVEWIGGAGNYAELHTATKTHLLRRTLTELEKELSERDFMRISRSLMVNAGHVRHVEAKSHGDFLVVLKSGARLDGSRNYRDFLHLSGVKRQKPGS